GITTDLNRRMAQHLNKTRGARFFHFSPPKVCVFLKHCDNRSEALKLESKIKKMSRKQKEVMIQNG
ncbi:MAG: GIY-YIG nuclease family protein, partial [Acidobacteria bacterium]|nr:GIY-YIG nuclease family protein [Acidobacteriota bacterium]